MGAFGKNDYATPIGALSPSGFFNLAGSGFYDYSGFSSREAFFGFSGSTGFTGFSGFCASDGAEFVPWRPTLVYPRSYAVLDGVVTIVWEPALPPDVCGDDVTYTIQFTRSFSLDTGWRTIAEDVSGSSFDFDVSTIPFTEDGGFRIRAKDENNLCSQWSSNIQPFLVRNHAPNPVSLLSPLGKETFDNSILLIWREADIKDIDGHDVFYKIEVTGTSSRNSGWTVVPGAESLPEGTTAYSINSFDFPEGDDYGLRISVTDELGASSAYRAVGGIKIRHSGNFIVDTLPPEGSVVVNNGQVLARDSRVKLSLLGSDKTTGIKDVRIRNYEEDCWGDWDTFVPEKFWDLSSGDGVKRVLVQYRDYAGNVSEACDCEIVSRVLCDDGNAVDIESFSNKLYVAFDKNGNLVEYRVLKATAAELAEPELTALTKLSNLLYVSTYDEDAGDSFVYKYDGAAAKVATVSGAKVLSMASYKDKVYMGLDDGGIMELDGTSLSTSNSVTGAVDRLRSDGTLLFASATGASRFYTFDGTTWKTNLV